ncbi:hypothetical protein QJS10_CPB12g00281 [Acorus calamus]|uniref:Uncharacterized protein n=1 Tax=Acorus calamus TaxID=4465 RepID=A0AAV9DN80_ACOCL|nr:hypothetical protein QJS10_CPB12g00281 [Acorus calamus]
MERSGGVFLQEEEVIPYVALRDEAESDDYRLNRLGYKQELGRHLSEIPIAL